MTAACSPHLRTFVFFLLSVLLMISSAAAAGLSGRVVDPDGRPVAHAEVIVTGPTASPRRVRTDADGRFAVPALDAGRYSVIASAPGLVSDPVSIEVTESGTATADVALRITAVNETLVVSAAQIDQP